MLSVLPGSWPNRVPADRAGTHFFRGNRYSFNELVDLRKGDPLADQITPEVSADRHRRCMDAIRQLGDVLAGVRPDAGVIVGNDQMEVFTQDHVPAFAVFRGDYVEGHPRSPEFLAAMAPGVAEAELDRTPEVYTEWPCLPELGRHMIERLMAEEFDVAQLTRLPEGEAGSNAAPHAYSFIYRRVMRDAVIPHVPVFQNTFYPPNQPSAARCHQFGGALARALTSWPEDRTVAVFASGGLSHFAIDEDLDRKVLDALSAGDADTLVQIPEDLLQSGTSEVKNWIAVAGAMSAAGLRFHLIDYVPCYRSEAGTGNAMAFGYWT
jgi:hypothetical protein